MLSAINTRRDDIAFQIRNCDQLANFNESMMASGFQVGRFYIWQLNFFIKNLRRSKNHLFGYFFEILEKPLTFFRWFWPEFECIHSKKNLIFWQRKSRSSGSSFFSRSLRVLSLSKLFSISAAATRNKRLKITGRKSPSSIHKSCFIPN